MKSEESPKIGLVTFAAGDPIWKLAALRLAIQAKRSKRFSKICVFDRKSLLNICSETEIQHFNKHEKGFGLWFWKPKIIIDFLLDNPEIDIVVYLDAGCELNFNNDSRIKFEEYLLDLYHFDAIVFQMELVEKNWSHKELTTFLDSTRDDLDSGQMVGGAHLMTRRFALKFCAKWEKTIQFENFKLLIDQDLNLQDSDFKAHRHDQSIFSLLVKKESNVKIRDSLKEIYFQDFVKNGAIWPIWTARNKSITSIQSTSFLSFSLKFLERIYSYFYRRRDQFFRTASEK